MLLWLRIPTPRWSDHNLKAERDINQFHRAASRRPNKAWSVVVVLAIASIVQFAGTDNGRAQDNRDKTAESESVEKKNSAEKLKSSGPDVKLPKNVADMREALLSAVQSAKIEELRIPYEWNELPPAISDDKVDDPIAYWKNISRDKLGLEILLIIDRLLALPPAKLNVGKDYENSALYVWPYLAELDLSKLTPRQQFELRTLVPPKQARIIMETKKWSWWRLAIGADGTWHSFMKHDH